MTLPSAVAAVVAVTEVASAVLVMPVTALAAAPTSGLPWWPLAWWTTSRPRSRRRRRLSQPVDLGAATCLPWPLMELHLWVTRRR